MTHRAHLFGALALVASATACGGGRTDAKATDQATTPPPATAMQAPAAATTPAPESAATATAASDTPKLVHHSALAGAAVGAAAGHMLGGHAVLGAAAGALIQHERNKHQAAAATHP